MDGSWVGVDGQYSFRFNRTSQGLSIQSAGQESDVAHLFRLDVDAGQVLNQVLSAGDELTSAIDSLRGIRLMRSSNVVETFFTFMCSANNNLARIIPMAWKLGDFGQKLETGFHQFPTVERIASILPDELRKLGFGYRGATIPTAARALLERGGEDWLESLKISDYRTVHSELVAIPGIGSKLADCICLYGYDFGEAVPLDTHLWQAFTRIYHPQWKTKAVTDFRYRESTDRFRERFGKLAGWAHLFLYFANQQQKKSHS